MASTFKTFSNNDLVTTRTLLHEVIPITGSIVSGTYVEGTTNETNIKNYSHGMFQSVFDYPFLSSSANHIFDITVGYPADSAMSNSSPLTQQMQEKKINIYNQMAQMLVGFDHTGAIRQFDRDGDLTGGNKIREAFFLSFARLLTKDEIQKNTFRMSFATGAKSDNADIRFLASMTVGDFGADTSFKVNSPAGEYGILFATASTAGNVLKANQHFPVGLLFYQAGVAVISGSVFRASNDDANGILHTDVNSSGLGPTAGNTKGFNFITGSTIEATSDGIRNRIYNLQFNNTTELNSTIYFCRMNHNEFNYSTNPTYLNSGKIRVKDKSSDVPVAYVTTIGLYNSNNELMATAKLSEPLRKDPSQEYTIRCRLDF